jgi:hypothetical protein
VNPIDVNKLSKDKESKRFFFEKKRSKKLLLIVGVCHAGATTSSK